MEGNEFSVCIAKEKKVFYTDGRNPEGRWMKESRFTREENEILYSKFCSSGQAEQKLQIAVEAVRYQEEVSLEAGKAYSAYLRLRRRPALQMAKEEENKEFLWITAADQKGIWGKVRWNLARRYPHFASAFAVLEPRPGKWEKPGSDGAFLYYPERWEGQMTEKDLKSLCQLYLHMVLHCLFGHMLQGEKRKKEYWDLACDIYIEDLLQKDFSQMFDLSLPEQIRRNVLGESENEEDKQRKEILQFLKTAVRPFHAEGISQYLQAHGAGKSWDRLFQRDSHDFWEKNTYRACSGTDRISQMEQMEAQSRHRSALAGQWSRIRSQVQISTGETGGRRGSAAGSQVYGLSLRKKKKYDYKSFLERFAFPGEELMLDLESFDYIPYIYSRQHYENLVFLEPLEYAEVHKLRELIIAIDTSGSCRGRIVRQFLEETYEILSRRENFFRKMRVHLIQCDSMIQGYACIESQEQWKQYVEHLKVQGFGGTDFRPVFRWVEQLREKKEIQNPGGLIYFTDGDGIYPKKAPDYETAFVFLNDSLKKGEVPSWAAALNLQISVEEE